MSDNWTFHSAAIVGTKPTLPGDELVAVLIRGDDTKVLTWTRDPKLTAAQFLAMAKREIKTTLQHLNTSRPTYDATPDVQPTAQPEAVPERSTTRVRAKRK